MPRQPAQERNIRERLIDAFERVLLKAVVPGQVGWIVLLIIGGGIVWKLGPADLKEVLGLVLVKHCWVGYVLAVVILTGAIMTVRWRERIYQQHMAWLHARLDQTPQSQQLNLPLPAPPGNQLPPPGSGVPPTANI